MGVDSARAFSCIFVHFTYTQATEFFRRHDKDARRRHPFYFSATTTGEVF